MRIFIILTAIFLPLFGMQIPVSGSLFNSRTNEKVPTVSIEFINPANGTTLGKTTTNNNGDFNTTITSVPFKLSPSVGNEFHWQLFDIVGRQVQAGFNQGSNSVTIRPVSSGVYFFRTEVNGEYVVQKIVSLYSNAPLEVRMDVKSITDYYLPMSKMAVLDSVFVKIRRSGFVDRDTVIGLTNAIGINLKVDKIPFVPDFKIKPFDVNGNRIDSLTLTFITSDAIRSFVINSTAKMIHVNWYDYKNTPDTIAKVTHNNSTFAKFLIGRKPKQSNTEKNLYGNGTSVKYAEPDTTKMNLNLMNSEGIKDSSHLYLKTMWTQRGDGSYVSFGDSIKSMFFRGPTDLIQPAIENWATDTLDVVVFTYNRSTNEKIDTAIENRIVKNVNNTMKAYILNNGEQILKYRINFVSALNDSTYQHFAARDWVNTARIWTEFTTSTNGVAPHPTIPGAIKHSNSSHGVNPGDNNIKIEFIEQLNYWTDGPGGDKEYSIGTFFFGLSETGLENIRYNQLQDKGQRH